MLKTKVAKQGKRGRGSISIRVPRHPLREAVFVHPPQVGFACLRRVSEEVVRGRPPWRVYIPRGE